MKKISLILTIIFLSLILVSCSGSSGGGSDPAPQEEEDTGGTTGGTSGGTTGGTSGGTTGGTSGGTTGGTSGGTTGGTSGGTTGGTSGGGGAQFNVTIDSDLTSAERSSLNLSIDLVESMQIDGSDVPGFTEIFSGSRSSSVVNYLNTRVNYVISFTTPFESRYVFEGTPSFRFIDFFGFNPSTYIWYTDLVSERESGTNVTYEISGVPRAIPSAHVGVIQLGNIFATPQSNDITNAITLVHEARHSDCPGGAWASDLTRFSAGSRIVNPKCGQLHLGPGGNDPIPWGPYAIDFIYSKAVELTCSSCTPAQKEQAKANALDVITRAFDILGTVQNRYGPPDMSNSAQVREDL